MIGWIIFVGFQFFFVLAMILEVRWLNRDLWPRWWNIFKW